MDWWRKLRGIVSPLTSCFPFSWSQVSLLPPGLARKRLWNKKYPVCITLADGERDKESSAHIQEEDEEAQKDAAAKDQQLPVNLYLFGRTGREKEEWFQHFLSASRAQPSASGKEGSGKKWLISVYSRGCLSPPPLPVFPLIFRSLLQRRH